MCRSIEVDRRRATMRHDTPRSRRAIGRRATSRDAQHTTPPRSLSIAASVAGAGYAVGVAGPAAIATFAGVGGRVVRNPFGATFATAAATAFALRAVFAAERFATGATFAAAAFRAAARTFAAARYTISCSVHLSALSRMRGFVHPSVVHVSFRVSVGAATVDFVVRGSACSFRERRSRVVRGFERSRRRDDRTRRDGDVLAFVTL